MTSPNSSISRVIPALVTLFADNVPAGVSVYLADPRVYVSQGYVALTGWKGEMEPKTLGGNGGFKIDEAYNVEGVIRAAEGDTNAAGTLDTAFSIFTAIQDALYADSTIGGICRFSWFREVNGEMGATDKGGVATEITFTIYVEFRTN